jgi:hypothetical protein
MSKLTMICESEIGQFTVTKAGLYAYRSKIRAFGATDTDTAWIFGICKEGDKIDGQYEGCGPITWKTVD